MTQSMTSASYSDPHVQFLSQVLQDIARGELLVPRFQRPFVWLIHQQLELLRSIRQGIPIGAIMVWRTSSAQISCYESLGPFPVGRAEKSGSRDYLLDGVQRLSTLYGALTKPAEIAIQNESDDEPDELSQQIPLRAYFDLVDLDFLFLEPTEVPLGHQLPLTILFDSVGLLRYQRALDGYANVEQMVEQSDRLAASFRQYKVPIIPIATDDLALATLTFQRINSQGQKMSDYHMLHALTWSSRFDLMKELESLRSELLTPVGWDGIEEDPILKVLKLILGLDVYKADIEELSSKVASNSKALEEAVHGIAAAAVFLRDELQVPGHEFVPYTLQIVLLADILRLVPVLNDKQKQLIKDWFWFITYTEAFSGISDDKLRSVHNDLRRMVHGERVVWSLKSAFDGVQTPVRYDFRAVRTKSFVLNMARTQVNKSGTALGHLSEYGRRAVVQAFAPVAFPVEDRKVASAFGNRIICPPEMLSVLRKALADGDVGAYRWLTDGTLGVRAATEVVAAREAHLFALESEFARATAGAFWDQVGGS